MSREQELPCPFKAGDTVVYDPDHRQYGLEAMSSDRLQRGQKYVVSEVQQGAYLVVAGHTHPGGGLHWSNFRPA